MDPIEPWVDREELRRLADALLAKPVPPEAPAKDATYGDDFIGYAEAARSPEPPLVAPPAPAPEAEATPPIAVDAPPVAPPAVAVEQQARASLAMAREIARRGGLLQVGGSDPVPDVPAEAPPSGGALPGAHEPAPESSEPPLPPAAPASTEAASPFVARLQAFGIWLQEGILAKSFFVLDRDGSVLIDEVQSPKLQQVARTLAQASRTANRQAGAAAIGNLHVKIAPDTVLEVVPVTTGYGPLILGVIVSHPLNSRNVEIIARGLQQVIDGRKEH